LLLAAFACIGCALVRNLARLALVIAGVSASLVADAGAAQLSLAPPAQLEGGWTRIVGRYVAGVPAPQFRATGRCPRETDARTLDCVVRSRPEDGTLWLDLRGTPHRLEGLGMPCERPELAIEMLAGGEVVARAPVAPQRVSGQRLEAAVLAPSEEPSRSPRRFGVGGQRYGAPSGRRTEAGVSWFLDSRVSIQLNYQRTAQPPTMSFDHDDGFLTRLLIGF
jgi:hypothetical protein